MAGATGLEPATSGVTGRRSNQLSYAPRSDHSACPTSSAGASLALSSSALVSRAAFLGKPFRPADLLAALKIVEQMIRTGTAPEPYPESFLVLERSSATDIEPS